MIYPIVMYGDPVLRQKAKDIEPGTDLSVLIEDMFETMHAANGVGLAAPQIGKSLRLFVVDGRSIEDEASMESFKKVFVNPQMVEELGSAWEYEEGCLSIPNIREKVARKESLVIKYFDENWNEQTEVFDGVNARVIQHEYDHIEGILFIDRMGPLKRRMINRKLERIKKGDVEVKILCIRQMDYY